MTLSLENVQKEAPPIPEENLLLQIRQQLLETDKTVIVLDDDPTGTQTVYDVPVLTEWTPEVITKEFEAHTPLFYILTNSRSLYQDKATDLAHLIGKHILKAAAHTGRDFIIISRSDSTLRGHYPGEVDALLDSMDKQGALKVIAPAFFEGGRYTYQDIHYVEEAERLIPTGDTPFAQDKTFGYQASDLKEWVEEKTNKVVKADKVYSFSIDTLRTSTIEQLVQIIEALPAKTNCILNAIATYDLQKFALAALRSKREILYRTAASFVAALGGLSSRPLLSVQDIAQHNTHGGLVVVGSYVPKTTAQLRTLLQIKNITSLEFKVEELLQSNDRSALIHYFIQQIDTNLQEGKDVVLYTSRQLVSGDDKASSLKIGNEVSEALTQIIKLQSIEPRYLIAKGGITSSDLATKALQVKKAMVLGQIIAGVPVWQLGKESKYPGMRYIIFPGNVGDDQALSQMVINLERRHYA
ncbi:four-carbon acid sugar kinase family protein [Porifericola rhodea]|uniref:four-carbon acid sugar kinase family protein n=1 Tax=Porifericola rhodea TaxID=930972 RepID=UPI00266532A0|nr:four-carbon acid sugar kinase family protein [Porifericola rhodea]WKN30863.1 four-carbon acid sugar kinase family protein [Porifericola rhodea]